MQSGIRASTKRTYSSVQRQFTDFCNTYSLCPVPATEVTLLLYITHLNKKALAHASVLVHLAAIRNLHIESGFGGPNIQCPQIKQALRAVKEWGPKPVAKSPIKLQLLMDMWVSLTGTSHELLWKAVLAVAFYGGLRASEYAATQAKSDSYPRISAVQYKRQQGHIIMYFTVTQTKTSASGIVIPYGCAGHAVCAVCAVKDYLNLRCKHSQVEPHDPLFLYNGKPVAKSDVDHLIKSLVKIQGLPIQEYTTHSLRAGAASTAAEAGFKDWEVQNLGGWRSNVYQSYIRDIRIHKAQFAKRLAQHAKKSRSISN